MHSLILHILCNLERSSIEHTVKKTRCGKDFGIVVVHSKAKDETNLSMTNAMLVEGIDDSVFVSFTILIVLSAYFLTTAMIDYLR